VSQGAIEWWTLCRYGGKSIPSKCSSGHTAFLSLKEVLQLLGWTRLADNESLFMRGVIHRHQHLRKPRSRVFHMGYCPDQYLVGVSN
jgi:hypothetical protein